MNTLGEIVLEELAVIRDEGAVTMTGRDVNMAALSDAALIGQDSLSRTLHSTSRPALQTVLKLIAVLSPAPDRAELMLRAAGHDISMDWCPDCKLYRELINLGPKDIDRKNEILELHGSPVFCSLRA